jgi:hypothetical protein
VRQETTARRRFRRLFACPGDSAAAAHRLYTQQNPGIALERESAMSNMDNRGKAFEDKFAHDEGLRFKAEARRNKLLGLWAAEKLGHTGEAASAYAKEVIRSDFDEPGEEDVFRKIRGDFDRAGVSQSDHQIRRTMEDLMKTAREQIMKEA